MATTHTSVCESKSCFSMLSKAIHFRGRRVWKRGRTVKSIKCGKEAEQDKTMKEAGAAVYWYGCNSAGIVSPRSTPGLPSHRGRGTHPATDILVIQLLVEFPCQAKVGHLQCPVMHQQDIPGSQVTVDTLGRGEPSRSHEHKLPQHPTSRMALSNPTLSCHMALHPGPPQCHMTIT